jgi:hypothetical protein
MYMCVGGMYFASVCMNFSRLELGTVSTLWYEICRLAKLPDLNQTNEYVRATLLNWIRDLTQKYQIDGYRIDTVTEVYIAWNCFYIVVFLFSFLLNSFSK